MNDIDGIGEDARRMVAEADKKRDALCAAMRLTGQLQAAHQLVEMINVPPSDRRLKDLVDSANILLRKAMLAAWEAQS